ncbi:hypothetical protein [Guillardia theta]|uniref:Uncharacterized protein n=1 Tax=Guillardia theta TaxID=55529 RepID=Q9AW59_GUITH|nr:hypothetical protein GTHECHR2148 [Guillardia theta]CAC27011.1 hypothetical protein [Guillardia theta]
MKNKILLLIIIQCFKKKKEKIFRLNVFSFINIIILNFLLYFKLYKNKITIKSKINFMTKQFLINEKYILYMLKNLIFERIYTKLEICNIKYQNLNIHKYSNTLKYLIINYLINKKFKLRKIKFKKFYSTNKIFFHLFIINVF